MLDLPKPSLGLNGLGGSVATEVARNLANGSSLITYGGTPFEIPSSLLIDRSIKVEGFALQSRMNQALVSQAESMMTSSADAVKLLIERHELSKIDAALKRQVDPNRTRKLVLKMKH